MEYPAEQILKARLEKREEQKTLRKLNIYNPNFIDFFSNDYLGYASNKLIAQKASYYIQENFQKKLNGSTGSRLISGNNLFIKELEQDIAKLHLSEKAIIFNSGYDANIGFWGSVPQRTDTVLYDELIHASIRDGIKLSNAKAYAFSHNNIDDLDFKGNLTQGNVYVAIESIYSMDGDSFNPDIINICKQNNWHLIVDEAHATGITGQHNLGMFNYADWQKDCFARIITFGKALGTHGACVVGNELLINYLINFARSFIYTTAPTSHQISTIKSAYEYLLKNNPEHNSLNLNIQSFNAFATQLGLNKYFVDLSNSPIKAIIPGSKEKTIELANEIEQQGFLVKPILSPTVADGRERIRICLHSFNSEEQIINLLFAINQFISKNS